MNADQRTALVDAVVFNREEIALITGNRGNRCHAKVDRSFHHGTLTGLQQAVEILTDGPDAWEEIEAAAAPLIRYEGDQG